eukprot:jgi/Tetstr1/464156/TSEL_008961.t1
MGADPRVALCCIARLENEYIREWVQHHRGIGVSRFFVYCNARPGEPRAIDALPPDEYPDCEVIPMPGRAQQIPAYTRLIRRDVTDDVDWVGFLDCDEFVVPVEHGSLPALIRERGDDATGTLALQWRMFDSNGRASRPPPHVGVREAYTRSWFYPCVKSFWRVREMKRIRAVQHVHTIGGEVAALNGFRLGPSHRERPPKERNKCRVESLCDVAFIAHYVCKSEEEYREKCARGCADGNSPYDFGRTRDKWCRAPEAREDLRVLRFVEREKSD